MPIDRGSATRRGSQRLITGILFGEGRVQAGVLERRRKWWTAAVTEESIQDFRFRRWRTRWGRCERTSREKMRLEFSVRIFHPDPRMIAFGPDGKAIVFYNDAAKTAGGITRISAKDVSRYTEFAAALGKLSGVFQHLTSITPPKIDKRRVGFVEPAANGPRHTEPGKERHFDCCVGDRCAWRISVFGIF